MKCVIPGGNVKILAKAIHMLAKIGDEMYVNPQQESISFRTVNMAKSAYSDFTFQKNFFSYYNLGDLEEEEAQKCKISMRSAMTIFKSAHTLDKQVETCHIHLEVDACNLVFILKYKNGVNKSHLSPILDSEKLQASYTKDGMTNELISCARTLLDALQNFPQNLIEITLEVTPQKLLLRNYVDDASVIVNTTRTQLALGVGEFDRYVIDNETIITFCLKEVKALLMFSESVSTPVSANFETAGKPMLLILKNQSFEANLLLSTLNPDNDSQTETSVVNRPVQPIRKKSASSRSISRRVKKSSNRIKNSIVPTKPVNNTFKNRLAEETIQNVSMNIVSAEANNSVNDVRERNLNKLPAQSRLLTLSSVCSMSSAIGKRTSEDQRKLENSVFSSITKRKSTCDEEIHEEKEREEEKYIDLKDGVSRSPPVRQVAKKARLIFQTCFQNTFGKLPGHDTILVEDSDENDGD